MELTLRTPAALGAAKAIRSACPEMAVGIGTILFPEQIAASIEAGAAFGVSPGVNPAIIRAAKEAGLPFGPGVMTPTDIDMAIQEGCRLLKFFPAESSGGLPHLQNIAAEIAGGVNLFDQLQHQGQFLPKEHRTGLFLEIVVQTGFLGGEAIKVSIFA